MSGGSVTALGTAIAFVIYFVWLMFLSWLFSRFVFRGGSPLARAARCVAASFALAWGLSFALQLWLPVAGTSPTAGIGELTGYLIVQLGSPLAVFLWEWRSFQRHWIDDEDIGEVFE